MKSLIKKLISQAVQNNLIWTILNATVIRIAHFASSERKKTIQEVDIKQGINIKQEVTSLSPDLTVMHGPFKGLRYSKPEAIGSSFTPKIIGSYEKELHPLLEQICLNNYSEIIDVGCAEGYYAVGLAMRIPDAKVFAYDINQQAIELCEKTAQLNNVADRLISGSFCDSTTLQSIPLTRKALIISDCEGYEKALLTKEIASYFANHDLLIEVHDFIDIEISTVIRQRFEDTHTIETVRSIDDITKAQTYEYDELKRYSLEEKRELLAEYRPHIMEWLYMTPLLK